MEAYESFDMTYHPSNRRNVDPEEFSMNNPKPKFRCYDVFFLGKLIDSVYYLEGMIVEEVKKSLVDHDRYNPSIVVIEK